MNAYIVPGIPMKHIRIADEKIKLKGLRILSVCCSYFGANYETILTTKERNTANNNTKKYYYYFLHKELQLTPWFILKNELAKQNKRNIDQHIKDVEDKLSINDINTVKIVEEISKYLK